MDDDILEARKSWVDKMVAWQKEHISDRQMTLILAFVIAATTAGRRWWLLASPLASAVLWEPRRLLCLPVRPSVPIWDRSSAWTRRR